jgi:hypothetical protein
MATFLRDDVLKSLMRVIGGYWKITGEISIRGGWSEDSEGYTSHPEYDGDIVAMSNPRYTVTSGIETESLIAKIWDWAIEDPGNRPLDVLPRLLGLKPGPYSETWLYDTPDGDGPIYGKGVIDIPTFMKSSSLTREKFLEEMGKVPLPKIVYPEKVKLFWYD